MQNGLVIRKAPDRKQELRATMRAVRRDVSPAMRRKAARQAATFALRVLRSRRTVAICLSHGFELGTGPLIAQLLRRHHRLCAPRLRGDTMVFVEINRRSQLRRNPFGILEPVSVRRAGRIDAIVLPLLAVDATGHRLGQGGGFYDRALARRRPFRRPLLIGYAYAAQQVKQVPRAPHDIRLHGVVTERGIRWPTG
ncbi:MAG: 5-formyltetrahydrofolate cyclo-ligase [Casimicrobiaceae bacterium]